MGDLSREVQNELLGSNREQSRSMIWAVVGLFLGAVVLSAMVKRFDWAPQAFVFVSEAAVIISLASLLIGGVAAGINAARDGGILQSWLLGLAPFIGWLLVYHYSPGQPFDTVVVVAILALLIGPLVGAIAHALGRLITLRSHNERWQDSTGPVLRVLIGVEPGRTCLWGALATGLFFGAVGVVALGAVPVVLFFPFGAIGEGLVFGVVVTLAWLGLAAFPGYRDEGLVSSWVLVFAPVFGALLTESATDQFLGLPILVEATRWVAPALVVGITAGSVGYVLGAGVGRKGIFRSTRHPKKRADR